MASRIHIHQSGTQHLLIFSMPEASPEAPPSLLSSKPKPITHDMFINQVACTLCWVVNFPPTNSGITRLSRKMDFGAASSSETRLDKLPVQFSMNRFTTYFESTASKEGNSYYFDLNASDDVGTLCAFNIL